MTKKEWLIAAIVTFISIVAWMVSDVLHTRSRVEIPERVQEVLEPVNPNFDVSNLE